MKRFINVSTRTADGRTITQRYPARSVGKRPSGALGAVDFTCLKCGYIVCECPDGGWPPPIALEPPADVLLEGWRPDGGTDLLHATGARVRMLSPARWCWWVPRNAPDYVSCCGQLKPTRAEAMAAALPSVQPAEPYGCVNRTTDNPRECVESGHYWCDLSKKPTESTLRVGWVRRSEFNEVYQHEYARRVFRLGDEWRVMGDSSHPTLEAAMLRAEELARGEP